MGSYSRMLSHRLRSSARPAKPAPRPDVERLQSAAILRNDVLYEPPALRSHYAVRQFINPDDASPHIGERGDIEGFITSTGRFVGRDEAQDVALAAGQIRSKQGRPLLSSDIEW